MQRQKKLTAQQIRAMHAGVSPANFPVLMLPAIDDLVARNHWGEFIIDAPCLGLFECVYAREEPSGLDGHRGPGAGVDDIRKPIFLRENFERGVTVLRNWLDDVMEGGA